jgi:transcription elongation factor Elf1
MRYEFDTWEEFLEAMKHLEDYHDCKKCHGKIVVMTSDSLGNAKCGYCGKIVKYPRMKKEKFEDFLKEKIYTFF